MRVLLVEDQADVRDAIGQRLRGSGFSIDPAPCLADAELLLNMHDYAVLILDRMLPDGDSIHALERWRSCGVQTPALFLTALDEIPDRVAGLEAGADDYLVKPFAMEELLARVTSLGRRGASHAPSKFSLADLEVDLARRQARRGGVLLPLRPKEYAVLDCLVANYGRAVSREELRNTCWDDTREAHSNVEEAVIAALRRKLGKPALIHTVRGFGWVLEVEESDEE